MATTVRFFKDGNGLYSGVGFYGHARGKDDDNAADGVRVCAAMSVLASFFETLTEETADADYSLRVVKEPPSRVLEWGERQRGAMQTAASALFHTVTALSAQSPEFVKTEDASL